MSDYQEDAEEFTVEERLRQMQENCQLLADLFSMQCELADAQREVAFTQDSYGALVTITRACAKDLKRLLGDIPVEVANSVGKAPAKLTRRAVVGFAH